MTLAACLRSRLSASAGSHRGLTSGFPQVRPESGPLQIHPLRTFQLTPSAFFLTIVTGLMARSTVLVCVPCQGALLSPVEIRAGKLSLQPEALGAGQEATNGLKHSEKRPL